MVTYILRSRSPRFHGPVILPYILNTICWINVTPGILLPCDPGVVGWCEGAVYLTSLGRPTDIGLQLGKACYPCSG